MIFAEGAPTESLFTGRQALRGLAPEARAEILKLFPELDKDDGQPALHIPSGRLQKKLIERHDKNGKPLLELFVKPAG